MCSVFIHWSSTFFIRWILIDFPVDKDNSSKSFRNLNIFSYDLSILFIIKFEIFGFRIICLSENVFEIITEKEDFYKIKTTIEEKIDTLNYSSIEWRPLNYIDLNKDNTEKVLEVLSVLEDLDDVQNVFSNVKIKNLQ